MKMAAKVICVVSIFIEPPASFAKQFKTKKSLDGEKIIPSNFCDELNVSDKINPKKS